jgi:hypothetical protein
MLSAIKQAFEHLGNAFDLLKEEDNDSLFLIVVYCVFICFMTFSLILVVTFACTIA